MIRILALFVSMLVAIPAAAGQQPRSSRAALMPSAFDLAVFVFAGLIPWTLFSQGY